MAKKAKRERPRYTDRGRKKAFTQCLLMADRKAHATRDEKYLESAKHIHDLVNACWDQSKRARRRTRARRSFGG